MKTHACVCQFCGEDHPAQGCDCEFSRRAYAATLAYEKRKAEALKCQHEEWQAVYHGGIGILLGYNCKHCLRWKEA